MFFSGRLPKPPWETRSRVEALVKQYDRALHPELRRSVPLHDAAVALRDVHRPLGSRPARARGRAAGPFVHPRAADKDKPKRPEDRILHVAAFRDPLREMDKLRDLYDSLAEARREVGEEAVPFHKFADLVKTQVKKLQVDRQPRGGVPRGGEGREGQLHRAGAQGRPGRVIETEIGIRDLGFAAVGTND